MIYVREQTCPASAPRAKLCKRASRREWRRCMWHKRRIHVCCFVIAAFTLSVTGAAAQLPPPVVVPPVPILNPSSSLVLPQPPPLPVSPAPGGSPHRCHRSNSIRRRVASSAGIPVIHRSAAFSTMGRAFPIICRRSDKTYGSQSFQSMETTRSSKAVEMGRSMRSVRFATCSRRFAPAGCRPRNRRRDMVWNTPSASPLSAMAP